MHKQVKLQEVAEILAALDFDADMVKNVLADLIPTDKLPLRVVYSIDGATQKFLSEADRFCPNVRLEAIKLDTCYVAAKNYWQIDVDDFIRRKTKEYVNSPQWQLPNADMLQELKAHYDEVNLILQKMKLHTLYPGLYWCQEKGGVQVFNMTNGQLLPYSAASRFDVCRRLFFAE